MEGRINRWILRMLCVLTVLALSPFLTTAASEISYEVNMSDLPIIFAQELELSNRANSTLSVDYGDYLYGPDNIYFQNVGKKKVNINIELPMLTEGEYCSTLNTSFGQVFLFCFSAVDNPTIDDFGLSTDRDQYVTNESVYISIDAPDGTHLKLDILSAHDNRSYNATIYGSSMLAYIPGYAGDYTIKAALAHQLYNVSLEKSITVKDRFSCSISAPEHMIENETLKFRTEVKGGDGPYIYYWDFGDGGHSSFESPSYAFSDTGSYSVKLVVRDKFNNYASCSHDIDVNPITYTLEITVVDNSTGDRLGDAKIVMGEVEKKSNVNGKAVFEGLGYGRQRIVVTRDGYDKYSEYIEINRSMELKIALVQETPDTRLLPEVEILSPIDGYTADNEKLIVSFRLSSDSKVSVCKLLANEIPLLGYKVLDSIYNITDFGTKELKADISNGNYNIKISCENSYGMTITDKITVHGINFPEAVQSTPEIEAKKTAVTDTKKADEPDPSLTERFDKAIEDIDATIRNFGSYQDEEKKIADILGFTQDLERFKTEINKLKEERVSLEGLSVGRSSYETQKADIMGRLKEIEDKIPSGISILKHESFTQDPADDILEQTLSEYLGYRGRNMTGRELKHLLKISQDSQQAFLIQTEADIVSIVYRSGKSEEYSFISKRFIKTDNATGLVLVEDIPKAVAQDVDEITFSFQYELIRKDPLVGIPLENKEISYYVRKRVDFDELKSARTVIIPNPSYPANMMTGFSVFDAGSYSFGPFVWLPFLLVIISGGFVMVARNDALKENFRNAFRKRNIERNWKPEQNAEAKSIWKIKEMLPAATLIGAEKLSQEQKRNELVSLLNLSLDLLKQGNAKDAISLFPRIMPLYDEQDPETKEDLAQIMEHLGNEMEVYNFISLLDQAQELIINGMYDMESDLHREIEDLYTEFPEELSERVEDKYRYFNGLVNMKMFRKDTQLKMKTLRDIDDFRINDAVYGMTTRK